MGMLVEFDVRLFFHVILSTRRRKPRLQPEDDAWLAMVTRIAALEGHCDALAVGNHEDHVHLVMATHPATSLSSVVRRIKAVTSREWSACGGAPALRWERRWWARSVDPKSLAWLLPAVNDRDARKASCEVRARWERGELASA